MFNNRHLIPLCRCLKLLHLYSSCLGSPFLSPQGQNGLLQLCLLLFLFFCLGFGGGLSALLIRTCVLGPSVGGCEAERVKEVLTKSQVKLKWPMFLLAQSSLFEFLRVFNSPCSVFTLFTCLITPQSADCQ